MHKAYTKALRFAENSMKSYFGYVFGHMGQNVLKPVAGLNFRGPGAQENCQKTGKQLMWFLSSKDKKVDPENQTKQLDISIWENPGKGSQTADL